MIRLIALFCRPSAHVAQRINRIVSNTPVLLHPDFDTENELRDILRGINSLARVNRRFNRAICDNEQTARYRIDLSTLYSAVFTRNRQAYYAYMFRSSSSRLGRGDQD